VGLIAHDKAVRELNELHAGIRVNDLPEGLPFDTDADALLTQKMLNLRTPHGDLDLTFTPAAFPNGYDDLYPRAREFLLGGVVVRFADLDDVIAGKEAAGRQKDAAALPELYEIARRRPQPPPWT
jgi:hypothetical protein